MSNIAINQLEEALKEKDDAKLRMRVEILVGILKEVEATTPAAPAQNNFVPPQPPRQPAPQPQPTISDDGIIIEPPQQGAAGRSRQIGGAKPPVQLGQ